MNKSDLIRGIIGLVVVFGLLGILSYVAVSGVKIDKAVNSHYQPQLELHKVFEA